MIYYVYSDGEYDAKNSNHVDFRGDLDVISGEYLVIFANHHVILPWNVYNISFSYMKINSYDIIHQKSFCINSREAFIHQCFSATLYPCYRLSI